jgi:hypothetical protein
MHATTTGPSKIEELPKTIFLKRWSNMLSCDNDSPTYVRDVATVDCLLLPSMIRIVFAMLPSLVSFYPERVIFTLRGNTQGVSMPPAEAVSYVLGKRLPFHDHCCCCDDGA